MGNARFSEDFKRNAVHQITVWFPDDLVTRIPKQRYACGQILKLLSDQMGHHPIALQIPIANMVG